MKNGWAADAPEFGKAIVPSVAFWPEAGHATSQHTKPSNNDAPAGRYRVNIGVPQPSNGDLTLMLVMRTSSLTSLPPTKSQTRFSAFLARRQYHGHRLASPREMAGDRPQCSRPIEYPQIVLVSAATTELFRRSKAAPAVHKFIPEGDGQLTVWTMDSPRNH